MTEARALLDVAARRISAPPGAMETTLLRGYRRRRRTRFLTIALALSMAFGGLAWVFVAFYGARSSPPANGSLSPSPSESPINWVDGARPAPTPSVMSEDLIDELCVPWSSDRPDSFICGEVSDGFSPGPPPGVYPEICDLAVELYEAQRASGDFTPDVDTCFVFSASYIPSSDPERAEYTILFKAEEDPNRTLTMSLDMDSMRLLVLGGDP